jgi:hypothetical protein
MSKQSKVYMLQSDSLGRYKYGLRIRIGFIGEASRLMRY